MKPRQWVARLKIREIFRKRGEKMALWLLIFINTAFGIMFFANMGIFVFSIDGLFMDEDDDHHHDHHLDYETLVLAIITVLCSISWVIYQIVNVFTTKNQIYLPISHSLIFAFLPWIFFLLLRLISFVRDKWRNKKIKQPKIKKAKLPHKMRKSSSNYFPEFSDFDKIISQKEKENKEKELRNRAFEEFLSSVEELDERSESLDEEFAENQKLAKELNEEKYREIFGGANNDADD